MTTLQTLFSADDIAPVKSGIRKFIRSLGLEMPAYQLKWVSDEFDLISSIRFVTQHVNDSASLLGREKYKGQPFVFTDEVKKDMEEFLLVGRDQKETALLRKQNLSMYHLVIEPTIDMIGKLEHKDALLYTSTIIAQVVEMIEKSEDYGDHFDALVAKEQIAAEVRERAAAKEANKKKPRRRAKSVDLEKLAVEEIAEIMVDDSEMLFE